MTLDSAAQLPARLAASLFRQCRFQAGQKSRIAAGALADTGDSRFAEQQIWMPRIELRNRCFDELQIDVAWLVLRKKSRRSERQSKPSTRGLAVAETSRAIWGWTTSVISNRWSSKCGEQQMRSSVICTSRNKLYQNLTKFSSLALTPQCVLSTCSGSWGERLFC